MIPHNSHDDNVNHDDDMDDENVNVNFLGGVGIPHKSHDDNDNHDVDLADDNVNLGGVSIPHERPGSPPGHPAHPALSRPGELLTKKCQSENKQHKNTGEFLSKDNTEYILNVVKDINVKCWLFINFFAASGGGWQALHHRKWGR